MAVRDDAWQDGTFEVRVSQGDGEESAYQARGLIHWTRLFALDRRWVREGFWRGRRRRAWVVTHMPTGWAVGAFGQRRQAERVCRQLLDLEFDWQIAEPRRVTEETQDKVRPILTRSGELGKNVFLQRPEVLL